MEEISLRELIEILLKRKWAIVVTTLVCMFVSAILSFFVLEPVYESKSSFMVTPIYIASGINPNTTIIFSGDAETLESSKELENKMLGSVLKQVKYPQISINEMVALMNSTEYITSVLRDFNVDLEKYDYTENITIESKSDSNIIYVTVKYNDADTAIKIKDALINQLPQYVMNEANKYLSYTEELLTKGIEAEIQNLGTIKNSLEQFGVEVGNIGMVPESKKEEYQSIYNNYLLSKQSLEAYQMVKKEFDSIKEIDINELLDLKVLTMDRLPLEPISPKKLMNIAISAVLGVMVSVFAVLFIQYWKESGQPQSKVEDKESSISM